MIEGARETKMVDRVEQGLDQTPQLRGDVRRQMYYRYFYRLFLPSGEKSDISREIAFNQWGRSR